MQIELRRLSKHFGSLRANDQISLRFAAGQIHGVLGENGAGKSTMMKLLSGFLRRTSGEVLLDGKRAALGNPAEALQAGIGMVHQEPLDVPAFTAIENFYCASPRRALPSLAAARTSLQVLSERLAFTLAADAPLASLTVGQRQQLEIMRLLACGARVLILDEPTTGISAAQAEALFAALRTLVASGTSVLFVSHKLDDIARLCDTVSVLQAGRVVGEQLPMPQPPELLLQLMFGSLPAAVANHTSLIGEGQPVWRLDGVLLQQGTLRLHGLSLDVRPGEVVGLAGMEGSGQSLLLQALAGHAQPLAGCVTVAGSDLTGEPIARFLAAGVEYLPADRLAEGVIGPLSLSEHLALLRSDGPLRNNARAHEAASEAIAAYGIKATPDTPLQALSGGNQQRAMLALLPAHCTGIVMEQPTRGLDVASARSIWQRLLARREQGTAIVFASSDLDELLAYSDRVLVFSGGRVAPPLPRHGLSGERLAELIGGVGF